MSLNENGEIQEEHGTLDMEARVDDDSDSEYSISEAELDDVDIGALTDETKVEDGK